MNCYCCSERPFEQCCKPYINYGIPAPSAEALMRSRYAAYSLNNWDYILNTYSASSRSSLSIEELATGTTDTRWLHLLINNQGQAEDKVEFKAFYAIDKRVFLLHETSQFIREHQQWRYDAGTIHADSGQLNISRNATCFCGSLKKYKRCCLGR